MKKNAKNGFLAAVFTLTVLVFSSGCDLFNDDSDSEDYSREYWGEWIRMDTGENWYISNKSILVNNSGKSGVSMKKQSSRVIEVTEGGRKYYLFASRVNNGKFTGSIANLLPSGRHLASRAVSGIGGINIAIGNLGNAADKSKTKSNDDGTFMFEGTPGDSYVVSVDGNDTVVTPNTNGDDIGTITVTNGLNFKVKIVSTSDMQALFAGGITYDFSIEIENTGTEDCTAARFNLELDPELVLISGETSGILRTIEPRKSRNIPIRLQCNNISSSYQFKRINVRIEDSLNGNIWNDSVSIKFNAGTVNFAIRSETPINGVVISPQGKAYHFNCNVEQGGWGIPSDGNRCRATVTVPWSADDYLVVFSGATADTESVYTLGINMPNPDGNLSKFMNVMNYEPNNNESDATKITGLDPIISYLHKNDIDYYVVNVSGTESSLKTLAIRDCAYANIKGNFATGTFGQFLGNTDQRLLPGEQFRMDLAVECIVFETSSVSFDFLLSTNSPYVTINKNTARIPYLSNEEYRWRFGTMSKGGRYGWGADFLFAGDGDFRFTISENCPRGIKIPFTIKITDSMGNQWNEYITLPVEP